jgi:iron complex outermembrane receptor protein
VKPSTGALALALTSTATAAAAQQQPGVPLDTLEVRVGSRASPALPVATRAVEVITAEQLRAAPVSTIAEALAWALGADVTPRSPAQADLAMRGSSFEQTLVLVDGVRMSDAQSGHFDLDLAVPLEQVERIEVLRGAASALYGADAMGGVVNVVTRRRGPALQARAQGGSWGTGTLALAGRAGRDGGLRADLAGEAGRSDGHREGTDWESLQLRAAVAAPLAGRTLRADAALASRDFGAAGFYGPYPSYERTDVATASLAWQADAGARSALEPRVSARRHGDDYVLRRENPAAYRNRHTSWQLGGELVGRHAVRDGLRAAAGVEAFRDLLDSNSLGERDETRAAGFAEVAAGRIGAATLTAGARADWHSAYGAFLSPSLAGAWWPADALRLRASAGRAFRAPTWTERYYDSPANVGNPDLDPERAWSAEAGADWTPRPGARLAVGGWVRRTDALIDWARPAGSPESEPWRTRNVRDATFRGLEAEAAAEVAGLRWTAQASALSVRAADAQGYASKYALRPLVESASLAAERALPAGLAVAARGRRVRRAGEDAHLLAATRLRWDGARAGVFLDVQNVFGEEYRDIVGQAAPGRAVVLGVRWGGTAGNRE